MHPGDKKVKDNASLKLIFETGFSGCVSENYGYFPRNSQKILHLLRIYHLKRED